MHPLLLRCGPAALGLWLALPVAAQSLKPGLWEAQSQMRTDSGQAEKAMAQMQEHLAKMPPEQRKAMQDMMAKQGVSMGPKGTSARFCMSKEMASQGPEQHHEQGNCKSVASPRVGNTVKFSYTCTQPASSGEGEVTYNGDSAYTMKMTSQSTVQGRPEKMNMEVQSKWLGSDCGDLKPLDQMRKTAPAKP